jgi:hypothetical protein
MELVGDSLRYLITPGWAAWPFVTPIHVLRLCPILQHLEKPADILNRLPGVLFGNLPAGPALEYRDSLFNQFRTELRHLSSPNKNPAKPSPTWTPQGLHRLSANFTLSKTSGFTPTGEISPVQCVFVCV